VNLPKLFFFVKLLVAEIFRLFVMSRSTRSLFSLGHHPVLSKELLSQELFWENSVAQVSD
jgi:hypothetical protein